MILLSCFIVYAEMGEYKFDTNKSKYRILISELFFYFGIAEIKDSNLHEDVGVHEFEAERLLRHVQRGDRARADPEELRLPHGVHDGRVRHLPELQQPDHHRGSAQFQGLRHRHACR